jgi:2-methylisocitrate lyase-like PEP mutase family enzyme
VLSKRCGHLLGKELVDVETFTARIRAADAARKRLSSSVSGASDFVIIARTDALQSLGFDEAVARLKAAVAAGADVAFLEGMRTLDEMRRVVEVMVRPAPLSLFMLWGVGIVTMLTETGTDALPAKHGGGRGYAAD